jgi:hypothetical protein
VNADAAYFSPWVRVRALRGLATSCSRRTNGAPRDVRYWCEPDKPERANGVVPGARVCTVRSSRLVVLALRPQVGPVLQTEPDFGCVEYRSRSQRWMAPDRVATRGTATACGA